MDKLEAKIVLMNELLDSYQHSYVHDNGAGAEKMTKGDVYDVSKFHDGL